MRPVLFSFLLLGATGACEGDIGGTFAADAGGVDSPVPQGSSPEMYTADRTLSPITTYVADNLRAIAASAPERQDDVFAKVGDSATLSASFLYCFNSGYRDPAPGQEPGQIDLGGRNELQDVIAYFRDSDAQGLTSYERSSLAAEVGGTVSDILNGDPSLLAQEYAAIAPRFAIIMLGTNDLPQGDIDGFGSALLDFADQSIAIGVIPVFNSILSRGDDSAFDAEVPRYNAAIRGVAQSRQVPFIDLHRALAELPTRGLGPDGVHPSLYLLDDMPAPCIFDSQGLGHGYNQRNLLTIQTLDRLMRVLIDNQDAPDAPARSIQGAGKSSDPFIIESSSLPFTHVADTSMYNTRDIDIYDGCQASQNESGPEVFYRFEIDVATRIRATVIDRGTADIDVHLLQGDAGGDACVARDHRTITADVEPGTYYFSLDTFVGNGGELAGEYLFTVIEEP